MHGFERGALGGGLRDLGQRRKLGIRNARLGIGAISATRRRNWFMWNPIQNGRARYGRMA
jgi:hypothetical protein